MDDYQNRWFVCKRNSDKIAYYMNEKDGEPISHKGDIVLDDFDVSTTKGSLFISTFEQKGGKRKPSRVYELAAIRELKGGGFNSPEMIVSQPWAMLYYKTGIHIILVLLVLVEKK